ncbi:hypothetical protein H4R34_003431 [Dimargaris verticillata]|uniref:Uncharacterized protein n=1 Tax=Dimargaris verticillata TaxID=2761393 RepID=A0A9W8B7I6_9FUNG|nr:hypothetical protein H4R34_003431 [Dimargaris verticillata]
MSYTQSDQFLRVEKCRESLSIEGTTVTDAASKEWVEALQGPFFSATPFNQTKDPHTFKVSHTTNTSQVHKCHGHHDETKVESNELSQVGTNYQRNDDHVHLTLQWPDPVQPKRVGYIFHGNQLVITALSTPQVSQKVVLVMEKVALDKQVRTIVLPTDCEYGEPEVTYLNGVMSVHLPIKGQGTTWVNDSNAWYVA